jgi:hypothetical protein
VEEVVVKSASLRGQYRVVLKVLVPGKWFARTRYLHVAPPGVTLNGVTYTDAKTLVEQIGYFRSPLKVKLWPDADGVSYAAEFNT